MRVLLKLHLNTFTTFPNCKSAFKKYAFPHVTKNENLAGHFYFKNHMKDTVDNTES